MQETKKNKPYLTDKSLQGEKAYRAGKWAETMAVWYLRLKGYRIRATNFRHPAGEIDIIASKRNMLVCIEVKSGKFAAPEVLSHKQRQRITRATGAYLAHYPLWANRTIRFDLLILKPFRWPVHIQNAWME